MLMATRRGMAGTVEERFEMWDITSSAHGLQVVLMEVCASVCRYGFCFKGMVMQMKLPTVQVDKQISEVNQSVKN